MYNWRPNPIAKIAAVRAIIKAKKIWLSVNIKFSMIKYTKYNSLIIKI